MFTYGKRTHRHTGEKAHETKCSAVALIHHTQTHTYRRYSLLIWSLVGCFSFICRLFLFVINMTNIVSYYSVAWNRKQKFLFFLIILFVLSDRLLRDGTNTIGHLVVRPFLYISLSIIRNKKKNRARRRSTDRSGQNVLPVAKQLERLRYGCYLIRSLYLFLSMFYRPLKFLFTKNIQIAFIFIFFVSLFLSLFFFWVTISFVADGGVFASS